MANVNVRKKLEKIVAEIDALETHVREYSGIDPIDARFVLNMLEDLDKAASSLALEAGAGELARHRARHAKR